MEREAYPPTVDRYVIDEYLAEGGMGAIFLGKKLGLEGFEKQVVLKQLLPEFTVQREFIDLFLREARLSASLDHANIVHTLDLVAAGDDYFIVMEYVRGADLRTLQRRVKQRGLRLLPAAGLFIAREVLSALAYAHEKRGPDGQPLKLIHRDISPSNIMVSASGEVKLTDFGIAKASTHKSAFYRVKGKVGYMSPEQAFGDRPLDQRSDLYSLAVCLYEMLAGERLFVADLLSTPEQIYAQPLRPLEGRPGIPPGTDRLLGRALAEDPDRRYGSALELQDALVKLSFDAGLLFTARDLSDHLRQVCGPDPSEWGLETGEPGAGPGTEVLEEADDSSPLAYSGVELTSILPDRRDGAVPETAYPRLTPRADLSLDPEPPASNEGLDVTRFLGRPEPGSDESRPMDPAPGSLPLARRSTGSRRSTPRPLLDPRPGPGELRGAEALHRTLTGPPDPRTIDPRSLAPSTPSSGPDDEAAQDTARRAAPLESNDMPPVDTHRVRPLRRAAAAPARHRARWLLVVLLLILALAIIGVVGLSGPDLSGRGPRAVLPATASNPPPPTLVPDSGQDPTLAAPDEPSLIDEPSFDAGPVAAASPAVPEAGSMWDAPGSAGGSVMEVSSQPAEAEVFLDGVRQCTSPCTMDRLKPGGLYLLMLKRAGYLPYSTLVDMQGRPIVRLSAYLTPEPTGSEVGYLQVRLRGSGPAEIFIDGKQVGWVTDQGPLPLPPGEYEVLLSHPRRERRPRQVVAVEAGITRTLSIAF